MALAEQFRLMADYNRWMNARVSEAVARLPVEEHTREHGAFFGSVLGTLNHIAVADIIWLQRFASHPAHAAILAPVVRKEPPAALDQQLFETLDAWHEERRLLDDLIVSWADGFTDESLAEPLDYENTKGKRFRRPFGSLVLHFFNHQTHHRGQLTTLLNQQGVDVGVTDLLARIPEIS